MVLGKFVTRTIAHNVICTNLIDPDMKFRIDKFDGELEKRLDETNFVDDVGAAFYIDDVDEADEASHGDDNTTPSDKSYGYMMEEERPAQDNIDDAA